MVRISRCCCCLSLRDGTKASAAYALIIGAIAVGITAWAINELSAMDARLQQAMQENGLDYRQKASSAFSFATVLLWVSLVIYLLWFLSGVMVFVGIAKDKRGYLVPYLIVTGFITALSIFGIISYIMNMGKKSASLSTFAFQLGIAILNIYVFICVRSFYQNDLKEADEVNALPMTATGSHQAYGYQPTPAAQDVPMGQPQQYDYKPAQYPQYQPGAMAPQYQPGAMAPQYQPGAMAPDMGQKV